jgi:hypothetical protein
VCGQSESAAVRDAFLRKLAWGLARGLSPKYAAALALYADSDGDTRARARQTLALFVAQRRAQLARSVVGIASASAANLLPECVCRKDRERERGVLTRRRYMLPPLVHLLAHHPQFAADRADRYQRTTKCVRCGV